MIRHKVPKYSYPIGGLGLGAFGEIALICDLWGFVTAIGTGFPLIISASVGVGVICGCLVWIISWAIADIRSRDERRKAYFGNMAECAAKNIDPEIGRASLSRLGKEEWKSEGQAQLRELKKLKLVRLGLEDDYEIAKYLCGLAPIIRIQGIKAAKEYARG